MNKQKVELDPLRFWMGYSELQLQNIYPMTDSGRKYIQTAWKTPCVQTEEERLNDKVTELKARITYIERKLAEKNLKIKEQQELIQELTQGGLSITNAPNGELSLSK